VASERGRTSRKREKGGLGYSLTQFGDRGEAKKKRLNVNMSCARRIPIHKGLHTVVRWGK